MWEHKNIELWGVHFLCDVHLYGGLLRKYEGFIFKNTEELNKLNSKLVCLW